ncbi:MAG TPA: VWA domain-containing protein [Acidobacteriota bacterium]
MNKGKVALLSLTLAPFFQPAYSQLPSRPDGPVSDRRPVIKTQVDMVVADVLVTRPKSGRAVSGLKKEDFVLFEEGVQQQITHFSQNSLPLSVILLVDRGACLDPFNSQVRSATREALARLKPQDEVALMSFSETTELVQGFTQDRDRVAEALDRLPHHEDEGDHCFNRAFYEAASYMRKAGNPDGRRVIILITGWTTSFDCSGPSAQETRDAVLESGSVVCGLVPRTTAQQLESGIIRIATGVSRLMKIPTSSLKDLAEETGGEVFTDAPEKLDQAFGVLMHHLRTRYSLGFVSSNSKRDGTFRRLTLQLAPPVEKREGKLAVRTRRGYLAPRAAGPEQTTIQ